MIIRLEEFPQKSAFLVGKAVVLLRDGSRFNPSFGEIAPAIARISSSVSRSSQ